MSHKPKKIHLTYTSKTKSKQEILGLSALKNSLEKDFYSKVTIRNSKACCEQNNLVIEMHCNIGLLEMLYHLEQGTWGSQDFLATTQREKYTLGDRLQHIREINHQFIDIEELSIILKDCNIIIKKLAPESIEQELETILGALAENYVYVTRNLSSNPTEIFIPVFEEVSSENHASNLLGPTRIAKNGYYSYWGLYFDMDEHAVIYDLKNKSIISGELNLLNL
jgi:hypothetical protein